MEIEYLMGTKPNIIFFVMDALRAKNLGGYGYHRNTSPNIDSLAKKGVLFADAYSSNNATEKSFLAILSSRHLLLEGTKNLLLSAKELNSFFASGGTFLQEILKKKGYKTYCLKEIYGWQKRGFDYYYEIKAKEQTKQGFLKKIQNSDKTREIFRKITHHLPQKISDKIKSSYGRTSGLRTTKDAIRIIKDSKKNNENFFIWVDYNDTHIPYNPKKFTDKFKPKNKNKNFFKVISKGNYNPEMIKFWKGAFNKKDTFNDIIARYDSAIYNDDYLIGKILKTLKKEELIEDTIIFFFSDHGESFYEHGIYFSHHGLYDISTNFPLIIYGKGLPVNKCIKGFVTHEDLLPTILALLKINYDPLLFDGQSLLPLIEHGKEIRESVFMEEGDLVKKRALRTKTYKYIEANSKEDAQCRYCNKVHGGVIELYDLKKDPDENKNIYKNKKKVLVSMKLKLEQEIKKFKRLNEKRRLKKIFSKKQNL